MNNLNGIKIFALSSNIPLVKDICSCLHVDLSSSSVSRYSDGEIKLDIFETVRDQDVFIVQPTSPPANDTIMELLIMIDALKRASAGRVTAVIPYFGYSRQDRKTKARDPISAKLVADIITTAGADRVLTVDLHCAQVQGFFNIPVDHLNTTPLFCDYYRNSGIDLSNVVAVSPDINSVPRVRKFAEPLGLPLAIIDRRSGRDGNNQIFNLIGDVNGKDVIIFDDMIDTAKTMVIAADALKEKGANIIYAGVSHAILSGSAISRIENAPIEELVVLNTIELSKKKQISKIKTINSSEAIANAIYRIHEGLAVSVLFDDLVD